LQSLRWIGLLLSLVALAFIGLRFRDYSSQLVDFDLSVKAALALISMAAVYGLANLALAGAWRKLLEHLGEQRTFAWAFRVYGLSQLAKYVPGNVFHLASRQVIGMADGVATGRMARSAVWELGTISLAAATFAVFPLMPGEPLYAAVVFAALVAASTGGLRRLISGPVATAFLLYLLLLLVSGTLFFLVLALVAAPVSVNAATVCGAYVVAWLVGMLTPGAPAGLGVREVFLYGILQSTVSQADLLIAVALGRLVTVGGDLLFYLAASFPAPGKAR
jgi:uncharacterized membrane protein YbhN (UPF0104 family)